MAESAPGGDVRLPKIGLIGVGSVGAGWAAAYLAHGHEVRAFDSSPAAPDATLRVLDACWPAVRRLTGSKVETVPADRLAFASLSDVAAWADVIHENLPENIDVKRGILAQIEASTSPSAAIYSSSGGLKPSDLQCDMRRPERFAIVHPFNPAHLMPLVEIIGGARTAPETVESALALMRSIGKRPIRIDREMTAYLANRLQFALLREATHCLAEGVADARAIDDAVRFGLAPRWLIMGALMTFALAGGPGGMPALLEKFDASTENWWDSLGTPRLTTEVREKLIEGARQLAAGKPLQEWIAYRDERLADLCLTMNAMDFPD